MANKKIVGFTIEIDGQKQITQTTQLVGLLNVQFILLNTTLKEVNKSGSAALDGLDKSLKSTSSASKKMGSVVKDSLKTFEDSSKVIKDLGNGYFEVEEAVQEIAKTDKLRIKQLNQLSELTKEQEKELNTLLVAQQKQKNLQRERNAIAKQQAILETEAAGNRKARKAQLALVTIQLNKLTEAEQFGTKEGKRLTAQQLKLTNSLKKAEEAGGSFGRSVGDYAKGLLRADKVANSFRKNLTKVALRLSVGRSVVEGFSNGIRSAVQGLVGIVEAGDGTNEVFNQLEKSGQGLQATLKVVGTRFLNTFGSGIAKIIDNVSFVISVVSNALIDASESTGFLGDALRFVGDILLNFPAVFGGIIEASIEFARATKRSFTDFSISVQLAYQNFLVFSKGLAGFDTSAAEKEITRLNNALKVSAFGARTLGEAYTEGYNSTIAAQEEFNKQTEVEVKNQEKATKAIERKKKAQSEADAARKKTAEEQVRAAEKLKKDRADFLEQIKAESLARVDIAKDLQAQLIDVELELIKDATEQAIESEKVRYQRSLEERKENFKAIQDLAAEEEAKALELFGENSDELKAVQDKNDKELLEVSKVNDKLVEKEEQAHKDRLLEINKEAATTQADLADEIAEEAAAKKKEVDDKAFAVAEADKERKAALRKSVKDETINLVQTAVSAISSFVQIANDAETDRLNRAIDLRKESISSLNEELQNATGLQKKFLEQQIKQEEEALEKENKNKEKALREQANVRKGIAIGEAIVAAALGIANAFTLPPPASFIAAAATGIATAAQITTIAATKFQDGGIIKGKSHSQGGVPFTVAGHGGFEAEGDEFIVNAESTRKNLPLLWAINSKKSKFKTGGVVGTVSNPPNVVTANSRSDEFIKAIDKKTDAIINTVFDLQVRLDVDQLEDLQDNEANLKTLTTLGNGNG